MRFHLRVPGTRRGRLVAGVSTIAIVVMTATILVVPGTARDAFVAGQRGTARLAIAEPEAAAAIERASRIATILGLPAGTRREATRVRDRFEGGVVDEVTTFDDRGRPVAIARFTPDGTLRTAVHLGWNTATGDLRPERATSLAARFARAADLATRGRPETRRDAAGRGWSVVWHRASDGIVVRGDGTWVRLWPDGSLHSVASVESPLAAAPSQRLTAEEADRIVRRQLATWRMTKAVVAPPVLTWIAPNDLLEPARPDALGGPRRLAWIVRAAPTPDGADIRAIELYVDAGDGRFLGGDVLELIPGASRVLRTLALAATVASTVAACGGAPPTPAFEGRLVALIGPVGEETLVAIDGRGQAVVLAPPGHGLAAVATAADGRLAGSTFDDRLVVTDPDGAAWRELASDAIPEAARYDLAMPAWSPAGRLAVVLASTDRGEIAGLIVLDPTAGDEQWFEFHLGLGGYAPAWLDAQLLAVPTRGQDDEPTISVVDVGAGAVQATMAGARAVATSEDGRTLAVLASDRETVEVWNPAAWLAGDDSGPAAVVAATPAGITIDALTVGPDGSYLAVATSGGDDAVEGPRIRVWTAKDGWTIAMTTTLEPDAVVRSLGASR